LGRRDGIEDGSPYGPFFQARRKFLYDLIVHVGFKKGTPHLSKRLFHVGLSELSLASQPGKHTLQAFS